MTPDHINGCFEALGAVLSWKNFAAYCREREVAGVYWPGHFFWVSWGFWNLFYYTALNQPLSFFGGLALTTGSAAWLGFVALDKWVRRVEERIEAFPHECVTTGGLYCDHEDECHVTRALSRSYP